MNKLEGEWFNFDDVGGLLKKQAEISDKTISVRPKGTEPIIIGHTNKAGEKSYVVGFSPALAWNHKDLDLDGHICGVEFKDDELVFHDSGLDGCSEIYYGEMYFKFADAVEKCSMLLHFDPTDDVT
jgi:hypothetical protein